MKNECILALDQGTTSSRALVFSKSAELISLHQETFTQHYPADGWVEHEPDEIWMSTLQSARLAIAEAQASGGEIAAIGITNQRETSLIWDRRTGRPLHRALVWQDRRTAEMCRDMSESGLEPEINKRTGLLLDPYFSASKITWLLDHVEGARAAAEAGHLAFGTVDTFLIWKLTGGRVHVTDETNASRTMLFNIHSGEWDDHLLDLFRIPSALLPEVKPSAAEFGLTDKSVFGSQIPIRGVAGDQQAAAFGQGCHQEGMAKSTYGTGCFLLMHTGHQALNSGHRLLTTRACRTSGLPQFALEGSIFIAGAVVQWLRDSLTLIETAAQSEALAASLSSNGGVYCVPAFTGLGAPYWDAEARGAIFGLTRQSGQAELVRAALESVAYQTHDLVHALKADGARLSHLRIDGGMSQNNWLAQFIADMCDTVLERPANIETTAFGAAGLAAIQSHIWDTSDMSGLNSETLTRFEPVMPKADRQALLKEWEIAVRTTRYHARLRQDAC